VKPFSNIYIASLDKLPAMFAFEHCRRGTRRVIVKNDIDVVRKQYPTACCVHTIANITEYRIWPTNGWFETRFIGRGSTKEAAWKDAAQKIMEAQTQQATGKS
jgi:hypothetical protein